VLATSRLSTSRRSVAPGIDDEIYDLHRPDYYRGFADVFNTISVGYPGLFGDNDRIGEGLCGRAPAGLRRLHATVRSLVAEKPSKCYSAASSRASRAKATDSNPIHCNHLSITSRMSRCPRPQECRNSVITAGRRARVRQSQIVCIRGQCGDHGRRVWVVSTRMSSEPAKPQ
jgi:hypothetical protein